jgi:DNA primase
MLNPYTKKPLKIIVPTYNEKPPVANIEKIYQEYTGNSIRKTGRNLLALCAFHNESRPSMALYPETGTYYCFSCGATGDGYHFIMQKENCSFIKSLEIVKEKFL